MAWKKTWQNLAIDVTNTIRSLLGNNPERPHEAGAIEDLGIFWKKLNPLGRITLWPIAALGLGSLSIASILLISIFGYGVVLIWAVIHGTFLILWRILEVLFGKTR